MHPRQNTWGRVHDNAISGDRKMADVTNVVTEIAGAFSGGSLNTALGFYANPSEGLFPHPYSLNPAGNRHVPHATITV